MNDEFELADGFYSISNIQDYIEYIIKREEVLSTNPPIHIQIIRINNRFQIKGANKLELKHLKTKNQFSAQKFKDRTKNSENVLSLEVVEAVLGFSTM